METRAYFLVPFNDKEIAKRCGARFDGDAKCWYAPDAKAEGLLAKLYKPVASPHPITELPGEDRAFGGDALYIDLIPSSCWFTNVRYCIAPEYWERLAKGIRARAGQACEVCKGGADADNGVFLEAHERWHFDEERGVQTLKRIVCLCTACHRTTHYGLSQLRGEEELVRAHFKAVNDCDEAELDRHVAQAFETWQSRNERDWELDLSIITDAGIALKQRVEKEDRRGIAQHETAQARGLENHHEDGVSIREITPDDLDDFLRGL